MTSVRPKLKPDQPKTVTAWETATGKVVWMTADGSWSDNPSQLGVFVGDEAEEKLSAAQAQEDTVTDPYFMQVSEDGTIEGRETLRENIRANGPTIHPQFQRGAS
ncbi:DUF2849 domain-containing protein [Henriciella sp.]|uniref:DUF2849 domain-containing protein n=1 Tax=Henriciella sp. TaxID=1968823 RepID=UPI002625693E|nr:DUF2849 domain-containing protein [Henriciella sp.]